MEFEKLFLTITVCCIGAIALFSLLTYYNNYYGTTVGAEYNKTMNHVKSFVGTDSNSLAIGTMNSTVTPSGSGASTPTIDLMQRALSITTRIPILADTTIAFIYDAGYALGLNAQSPYISLIINSLLFSMAILFAYLLIIGVRRLL